MQTNNPNTQPTPKRSFVIAVCLYFASMNILQVIGYSQENSPALFTQWNMLCLAAFLGYMVVTRRLAYFSPKYVFVLCLYILSILATVISATIHNNTMIYNLSTDLFLPMVYVGIFLILLGRECVGLRELRVLSKFFVLFGVFVVAYNFVVYSGALQQLFSGVESSETLLTSAFYTNRNTYGVIVSIALSLSVYLLTVATHLKSRLGYGIVSTFLAIGMLLSMSRSAIVLSLVFMAVFFTILKGWRGIKIFLIILALFSGALIATIGANNVDHFIVRSDSGLTNRDQVYSYGLSQYLANDLLFGVGPQLAGSSVTKALGVISYHSNYLSYLVNGGLLLLTIFLLIILSALRVSVKLLKHSRTTGALFIAMILAYLVYGSFETNMLFIFSPNSFMISIYVAVLPILTYNYLRQCNTAPEAS